jgi:hypothetical protein
MDFGTINLILFSALMIYFVITVNRFFLSLNPYDFTLTQKQEIYDSSTKKITKTPN